MSPPIHCQSNQPDSERFAEVLASPGGTKYLRPVKPTTEPPMTAARQPRTPAPANFTAKATLVSVVLGIVLIVSGGYASYIRLQEDSRHTVDELKNVSSNVIAMRSEVSAVQREQAGMRSDILNLDARMDRQERMRP